MFVGSDFWDSKKIEERNKLGVSIPQRVINQIVAQKKNSVHLSNDLQDLNKRL